MEPKNHYEILGVAENANFAQIKVAYRKLARKYHPDVSKETDAETKFKEIAEIYAILKSPEKRAEYDLSRALSMQINNRARSSPSRRSSTAFTTSANAATDRFSDFFESMFRKASASTSASPHTTNEKPRNSFRVRGQDIHHKLAISIENAHCGGAHQITVRAPQSGAHGVISSHEKTLNVKIPAGVTAGQRIRLPGQGTSGIDGGEPGDLFLEIAFDSHPLFSSENRDILLKMPVTDWEIAIGTTVDVPTLSGNVKLRVPAGSNHGDKLRIKGKGLAGAPPGDQLVTLEVVTSMHDIINSWRYDAL